MYGNKFLKINLSNFRSRHDFTYTIVGIDTGSFSTAWRVNMGPDRMSSKNGHEQFISGIIPNVIHHQRNLKFLMPTSINFLFVGPPDQVNLWRSSSGGSSDTRWNQAFRWGMQLGGKEDKTLKNQVSIIFVLSRPSWSYLTSRWLTGMKVLQ